MMTQGEHEPAFGRKTLLTAMVGVLGAAVGGGAVYALDRNGSRPETAAERRRADFNTFRGIVTENTRIGDYYPGFPNLTDSQLQASFGMSTVTSPDGNVTSTSYQLYLPREMVPFIDGLLPAVEVKVNTVKCATDDFVPGKVFSGEQIIISAHFVPKEEEKVTRDVSTTGGLVVPKNDGIELHNYDPELELRLVQNRGLISKKIAHPPFTNEQMIQYATVLATDPAFQGPEGWIESHVEEQLPRTRGTTIRKRAKVVNRGYDEAERRNTTDIQVSFDDTGVFTYNILRKTFRDQMI